MFRHGLRYNGSVADYVTVDGVISEIYARCIARKHAPRCRWCQSASAPYWEFEAFSALE